ncbi:MAG TPA: response regulator transcription factor [Blastocatellia bacterium]|nr:response regulator transcription factor [Blastocatellia bacterium]
MSNEIRVIIADDHPLLRQGLRQVIERDPDLKVIAEAGDGHSALNHIQTLRPHIAVLDINMPGMDGFAVVRALREKQMDVSVIFLTVHREGDFFDEAIGLGVEGYVLKDSAITDVVAAIKAVAAGQRFASPAMTSYLMSRRRSDIPLARHKPGIQDLTPTERRIVELIAQYKTSREIAEKLFISYRTVQTHRANICQKLGLQGNHALMKFALAHKDELF